MRKRSVKEWKLGGGDGDSGDEGKPIAKLVQEAHRHGCCTKLDWMTNAMSKGCGKETEGDAA